MNESLARHRQERQFPVVIDVPLSCPSPICPAMRVVCRQMWHTHNQSEEREEKRTKTKTRPTPRLESSL